MSLISKKELALLGDFSRLPHFGLPLSADPTHADEYKRRGRVALSEHLSVEAMRNYVASLFVELSAQKPRWAQITELRQLIDQAFEACVTGTMIPPPMPRPVESHAYYRGKESASYGDDITNPYALSPARGDWRRGFRDGRREISEAIKNSQADAYPYPDRFAPPKAELTRPPSRAKRQYVKDRLRQIERGEI